MKNVKFKLTGSNISNLIKDSLNRELPTEDLINAIIADYYRVNKPDNSFFTRSFKEDIAVIDGAFTKLGLN